MRVQCSRKQRNGRTFYNERQKIHKNKKVNTRSLSLNEVSGILFLGEKSVEVFHCLESEVPINARTYLAVSADTMD